MTARTWAKGSALLAAVLLAAYFLFFHTPAVHWTASEKALIASLWLENLPPLPQDNSNRVADLPEAAEAGRMLFSDPRLSINGEIACSSCHQPDRQFTDGLETASAIGQSRRNTPGLTGAAWSPWLYWDGRRDSLWSQALSPLEDPAEHGGNRLFYAHLFSREPDLRESYENLFGSLPDLSDSDRFPAHGAPDHADAGWERNWNSMSADDQHMINTIFSNIGKMLAAYERTLVPSPAAFDHFAGQLIEEGQSGLISDQAQQGLRLFIGEARCIECHNGPLFTNNEFHNTGLLSPPGNLPDRGRIDATGLVLNDPFNCLGEYSDAAHPDCRELRYMRTGDILLGSMRTPSLRNLADTAPYMHKGQIATIEEVLQHYNRAEEAMIGHNEAEPLGLSRKELAWLEAFLETLME